MDYKKDRKLYEKLPFIGAAIAIIVIIGSFLIPYIEEEMEKSKIHSVYIIDGEVEKEIIGNLKEERKMIKGNTTETLIRYIEIDSNTGNVIKIEEIKEDKMLLYPMKIASIVETDFYASWMLKLKENITWTEIIKVTEDNISKIIKATYFVDGYEKIDERKCFKVNVNYSETFMSGVIEKTKYSTKILWVDVEKRFIIKADTKTENAHIIMYIQ